MTLGQREFEIYAQPARTRDDDCAGARGVAVDVTERREAERIAAATLEDAVADSRHSADLVSLLSHGLRMPLATVLGYADLLVNDAETDTPEAGGAIARAASEILETLDGFLDLTRLSALRTAAPTAIGTSGLRATIESAAAEGASGVPATLDVVSLEAPVIIDLALVGAVVRRVAALAEAHLDVRTTVEGERLTIGLVSPGLAARLGADSLGTAYVHHAVAALGADLVLGAEDAVEIVIPVRAAPVVVLEPASGDGALGWAPVPVAG